jgi:hypothetical protein
MEEGRIEKASGGNFTRTTRKTAEDEGRRRGGLGHDANRLWRQKVGQMSRVFRVRTTGRFEVEDFAIHILSR